MDKGYRLMVRYMHCIGPQDYEVGRAQTVEEAEEWKASHQVNGGKRFTVPDNDPVRWCPVRHCHMKIQTPVFFFSQAGSTGNDNEYMTN